MMMSFRSGNSPVFLKFGFQCGKRLDDADHILMWADASGVEQERVGHLVPLGDELAIGVGGMSQAKAIVEGVVDDVDLVARYSEQALRIFLGEIGNSEDACCSVAVRAW